MWDQSKKRCIKRMLTTWNKSEKEQLAFPKPSGWRRRSIEKRRKQAFTRCCSLRCLELHRRPFQHLLFVSRPLKRRCSPDLLSRCSNAFMMRVLPVFVFFQTKVCDLFPASDTSMPLICEPPANGMLTIPCCSSKSSWRSINVCTLLSMRWERDLRKRQTRSCWSARGGQLHNPSGGKAKGNMIFQTTNTGVIQTSQPLYKFRSNELDYSTYPIRMSMCAARFEEDNPNSVAAIRFPRS